MEDSVKRLIMEFNEFCEERNVKNTFENYIYWKNNTKNKES